MLVDVWGRILGRGSGAERVRPPDDAMLARLHLPLRVGGCAAGGVEARADAAFVAGSVSAIPELKRAIGG
eukprot:9754412-Alexandrium_andersonii.AAC.1